MCDVFESNDYAVFLQGDYSLIVEVYRKGMSEDVAGNNGKLVSEFTPKIVKL